MFCNNCNCPSCYQQQPQPAVGLCVPASLPREPHELLTCEQIGRICDGAVTGYFELENEHAKLRADRDQLVAALATARDEIKQFCPEAKALNTILTKLGAGVAYGSIVLELDGMPSVTVDAGTLVGLAERLRLGAPPTAAKKGE